MSSPPSTAIPRLPFDVLGCIFSHYAENESIHHPLETLLIVCRSWNDAALGHRTLWNDLRIYLGHNPSSQIWRKRLPLRLARAGPAVPLSISLFNILDMEDPDDAPECVQDDPLYSDHFCTHQFPASWAIYEDQCPCYNDARECAEFALECLAGNNGELCSRWKEFHVDLGYGPEYDASRSLAIALSYPTPSLTSLQIANIILDQPEHQELVTLIETPRLQELIVKDCYLLQAPNLQNLLEVELDDRKVGDLGGCSDLQGARQLQTLRLRHISADGLVLPEVLPNLHSIEIIGEEFPMYLHACQVPNLSILALEFIDHNHVLNILMCPGIDIQNLQKLSLIWAASGMDPTRWMVEAREDMIGSLCGLLNRAPNLSYIAGNRHIVNLFFKILWDSWSEGGAEGILGSKQFSLHFITEVCTRDLDEGFKAHFTGNGDPGTLVTLAKQWGLLSPDLPIDEFLNLLPDLEILEEGPAQGDA